MSEIIDGIFFVSVFVVICQFSGNDFDNSLETLGLVYI